MRLFIILLLTLSFAVVDLTAKDDLVKLQKKEAKRRKKVKKATLIITDDNLKKLSSKSKNKVSTISGTVVISDGSDFYVKEENKSKGKKPDLKAIWQREKIGIEDSIKFYKERIVRLQSDLNKLSSDFLIIDFPPSKNQIKKNITKTREDLKNSKEKLSFYKKELEKFYERARRQSIPPGWLR